tara:strand:- start:3 stop:1016 length:1014 start_codon:yes stop_codon:yes gene_type:complete
MYNISGSIAYSGDNRLNQLTVVINNPDFQHNSVYNKLLELYLNIGSEEAVPFFRGYIKEITPSDNSVFINAIDVRSLLTSDSGSNVTFTEDDNADGKTIAQFLNNYITDKINFNDTLIGLDMLRDSDPPVFMTGVRGQNLDVYKTVVQQLKKAISYPKQTTSEVDDVLTPLRSFLDVYEGANISNITIVKEKGLEIEGTDNDVTPSYTFSFNDGIIKYKAKGRQPANTVIYESGSFEYTNRPSGVSTLKIKDTGDRAENRNLALEEVLLEQQMDTEISLEVSKGYDIGLGTIIYVDVEDELIRGEHRVQGKKISFGSSMSCTLTLNRHRPKLSDYLS